MQNNIFKDMMIKAEQKDKKHNESVQGFFEDDPKTKIIGIITLGLVGVGAYFLYKANKADIKYKRM